MEDLLPVLQSLVTAVESPSAWDKAGVILSGASVILSAVAIWFAVQIPKKIARQQDKIALFEKRIECYQAAKNIILLKDLLKERNSYGVIEEDLKFHMQVENSMNKLGMMDFLDYLENSRRKISASEFLFDACAPSCIVKGIKSVGAMAIDVFDPDDRDSVLNEEDAEYLRKFVVLTEEFEKEYLPIMEKALDLKNIK